MGKSTLIVVDIQNDFCQGGSLEVADSETLIPIVNDMIAMAQSQRSHIILTQDWHPPHHSSFASNHPGKAPFESITMPYGPQTLWPDHCVQGTHGADFHPDLHVNHAELIVHKGFRPEVDSYSAFFENDHTTPTGLGCYLRERGIHDLTLTGLATDFCVAYSALDAAKLGFTVTVPLRACRAINLNGSLENMLREMQHAGVILHS